MSNLFRKQAVALIDLLAVKSAELRESEAANHALAKTLQQQASVVESNAAEDARQAVAIEEAYMVLDRAGVTL